MLVGAICGFLDSLVFCWLGTDVPTVYRALIFPVTLLVATAAGLACALLGHLLDRFGLRRVLEGWDRAVPFLLLAGPVLLQLLRSEPTPNERLAPLVASIRWGLPVTLVIGLIVVYRRCAHAGGTLSLPRFVALALVTEGLTIFAAPLVRSNPLDLLDLSTHHRTRLAILLLTAAAYASLLLAQVRRGVAREGSRPGRAGAVATVWSLLCTVAVSPWSMTESPLPPVAHPAAALPAAGAPTTLLIVLDTVRQDHLSCYGYGRRTTPRIDKFASRATVFENALATSPYTLSSHASLFTGRLPSEHGAHRVPYDQPIGRLVQDFALSARQQTLAEGFLRRGYHTGAVAANAAYLAKWTGLQRGFEQFRISRPWRVRYWPVSLGGLARWFPALSPPAFGKQRIFTAPYVTDAALEWLRSVRGQPSFLFLNYMDAHAPYRPPPPFDRSFLPEAARSRLWPDLYRPPDLKALPSTAELRYRAALYDGALAFLDEEVGRLLTELETAGLLDQMLVVITSDHGEAFGEHGLLEHGWELYEDVLRIPLIVKLPGQQAGTRVRSLVSLQDVKGLIERVVDGERSPSALGRGLPREPRVVAQHWISQSARAYAPRRFSSPYLQAVYDGRWKLIQRVRGASELFDLQADAAETRDLFHSDPAAAGEEEARLAATLPPAATLQSSRGEAVGHKPEDLDGLRALGYIN